MIPIEEILEGMAKMWEPKEEEFAITQILLGLHEETCPIHGMGERDFDIMRWKCPICGRVLGKNQASLFV